MKALFKNYYFTLLLLFSIIAGSVTGYFLGSNASVLKPLGDVFLNLLFVTVVPLVFFSIASSVAHIGQRFQLFKLLAYMFMFFIITGIIAAVFMIVIVSIFPLAQGISYQFQLPHTMEKINIPQQIVNVITVSDFTQLLSHTNMMPLILFSFLTGLACSRTKDNAVFSNFLRTGTEVFLKVIGYIMYYAPIGFFAFFAVLTGTLGPGLLANYFKVFVVYYSSALIYFFLAFTLYAFIAGGMLKVKLFWKNVLVPMMTALATSSSAASIPANLIATRNMGVSEDVCETVIPIGAMLHKDGTVLGAIVKISFLFGVFGMSFSGISVFLTAILIAIMVGSVMGAIPSGGLLGEMLILSLYGFPPEALPIIAAISLIIDPLATMLNVTGDSVCAMLIDSCLRKKPSAS